MKTLDQKMRSIGNARRKKVNARASGLIAEEVTLQELQQARKVRQTNRQGSRHQQGLRSPSGKT